MTSKLCFRISLTALLTVIAIAGCKKDTVGNVSGTFTVYDPSTPMVRSPVDNIWVYLLKAPSDNVKVNPWTLVIDSVMTGSDGRYTFTSLIAGTYAVSPFPSGKYMFSTDTSGSTFSIIEAGQNYEINFTSPISGSENYQNERSIRIYSVNCPEGMKILVKRQIFNYFFGSWESEGAETAQQLRRDGYYMRFQTLWNTKDSTKIYFESIPEIAWGSNYAVFDTFFIYADKERYKIWLHDGVISDAWYLDWKEKRVRWYH